MLGRTKVEVLFKDDRYQPQTAVQACREMAASAFFVVGGGGTDQIQACGRFANQAKVPYFSAGVTETRPPRAEVLLRGVDVLQAAGPLLAQYVKKKFAGKKVAAIITDTPNFDDAVAGWEAGRQAAGPALLQDAAPSEVPTPPGTTTFANEAEGRRRAGRLHATPRRSTTSASPIRPHSRASSRSSSAWA